MKDAAARLLRRSALLIKQGLIPDRCAFCGAEGCGFPICGSCIDVLSPVHPCCERCAAPLAALQPPGTVCGRCQLDPPMFCKAVAAHRYEFPLDEAIKAFKFRGQLHYGPAFAALLLPALQINFANVDALIPVPLHRWRHACRGFNQAAEICGHVARATTLPMVTAVRRIRATPSQSGLNASARRNNLKNAFVVRGKLHCHHPLIIDDVMTTGETCRQIARVLISAGARSIGVLVVARA